MNPSASVVFSSWNELKLTRDAAADFSHQLPGLQYELTSVLLPLLLMLGTAVVLAD